VSNNPLIKAPGARLILIVSAIALAFTGLTFWLLNNPPGGKPKAAETSQSSNDKTAVGGIGALGRLEPEGEVFKVAPPAVGLSSRIFQLNVREGDLVKVNQQLAVTDAVQSLTAAKLVAQAQVMDAQAQLAQVASGAKPEDLNAQAANVQQENLKGQQAEQELDSARLDSEAAQVNQQKAQTELKKAEWELKSYGQLCTGLKQDTLTILNFLDASREQDTVCTKGAVSEQSLRNRAETYRTQVALALQADVTVNQAGFRVTQREQDIKRAISSVAESNLRGESLRQPRKSDVQRAQAQLEVARANLQKAEIDLNNAAVTSPIDGTVLKIHVKPGETVGTQGVMEIGRTSQMYAVAEVDENLVGRVKEGQVATVRSDAFEGEITGKVVKIGQKIGKNSITSTDPKDSQDTRVVEVKIKLDNSQPVAGLTNLQVRVSIQP
jgi:HlyD family secretion protein